MYCVSSGIGALHTVGHTQQLKAGDVFFTFPAAPFRIESVEDFSYMYVSFIGARGNMIMEKLSISKNNFYFPECAQVLELWKKGLDVHTDMSDLISEGILLVTFAYLGSKKTAPNEKERQKSSSASVIKKYVDDNFSSASLSLESVGVALSYNPKYISTVFKKNVGMGFSEYLNTVRVQHACEMMRQGFTSITDIATLCGFSDPQYFSKVFKKRTGISPSEYIKEQ